MLTKSIRRTGLLLAITGVGILAAANPAAAQSEVSDVAARPAAVVQTDPSADARAAALAWDVTFDRYLTAGLWNAAGVSAAAFAAYCVAFVPGFAQPACLYIANSSLIGQFRRMGPPNGRCLRIAPRLGIPPYRLSYVTCP